MTTAAFLWLARRSLCLPGRLARKFFGSFFLEMMAMGGRAWSEEFIVVCLNGSSFADLFSTFAGDVVRFLGNQSAVDNFKLMETDVNFLLIGAT